MKFDRKKVIADLEKSKTALEKTVKAEKSVPRPTHAEEFKQIKRAAIEAYTRFLDRLEAWDPSKDGFPPQPSVNDGWHLRNAQYSGNVRKSEAEARLARVEAMLKQLNYIADDTLNVRSDYQARDLLALLS
jgi:hypothetical protein